MSALQFSKRLAILALVWASPLLAQQQFRNDVSPAAKGPEGDLAVGYSYSSLNLSGKPAVNLSGIDGSATLDFAPAEIPDPATAATSSVFSPARSLFPRRTKIPGFSFAPSPAQAWSIALFR